MGFKFLRDTLAPAIAVANMRERGKVSAELLHRQECNACPLNRVKAYTPKMKPDGRRDGLIYVLGGAPTERADDDNRPIAGPDLTLLRRTVSKEAFKEMRFNNAIRCHPGTGKELDTKDKALRILETKPPQFVELECCRPSIVKDIEAAKPEAIFSFGSIPLKWSVEETHPASWQGRRIPVRVGSHTCWLYPFVEPNFLYKDRRWEGHESDNEIAFKFYLNRAAEEVLGGTPTPVVHEHGRIHAGLVTVDGKDGWHDIRRIEEHLHRATGKPVNGLDYETDRLRPYNKGSTLLTVGVSYGEKSLAFAMDHREAGWTQKERDFVWDMFRDYLRDKGPRKAVHQLAFEMEWTAVLFGEDLLHGTSWGDTISQAYIINETQGLLSLEALTVQHYGFNIKELSKVDRRNLAAEPLVKLLPYNGLDAKYHWELWHTQAAILEADDMVDVYEHQARRIPALVLTQVQGIPIDQAEVRDFRKDYDEDAADALVELRKCKSVQRWERDNGKPFEPSNSQQFASLLKQIGIKLEKTEKGGDATSVKKINQHSHKDPSLELVWRWRKATKVVSTYMDAVTPGSEHLFDDGRAHPIISTTKVETWRTSSEDPNIQNWPKRNENAKVRRCVNQLPTHRVVSFDYAGIQGRNVAMESRDRRLTQHFIDGYDIHTDWLLRWNKICPSWFTEGWTRKDDEGKKIQKALRHGMKNQFVFPSFFGARPSETMCGNLQGTGEVRPKPGECAELQEEFFDEFPEIAEWHKVLHADYRRLGYVTGLSKHRRHAPVTHNQIINSPIQADESIIVMSAHIALSELDHTRYQPGMMIHDDLTFLWHKDDIDRYAPIVIEEMTRVRFDWVNPLPLEVEMSVGADWASTQEVGAFKNRYTDGRAGFIQLKGNPLL